MPMHNNNNNKNLLFVDWIKMQIDEEEMLVQSTVDTVASWTDKENDSSKRNGIAISVKSKVKVLNNWTGKGATQCKTTTASEMIN